MISSYTRNEKLFILENLDWYYVPPTEMFRRQPTLYSLFDLNGIPTHDAAGSELDGLTIKQLHNDWEKQKKIFKALGKLARQYM
jgi:hypothetical protein